ncbi:DUF6491 family protein [Thalassotalea maritima]|uniref:DUF6491 family protein n=1 Tax=Thalassotalea maritima TaxID=3242416 RepID=UPI003528538B
MKLSPIIPTLIALTLSACASNYAHNSNLVNDTSERQQISKVCFASNLDAWHQIKSASHNSIIVEDQQQTYQLNLIGSCDPKWPDFRVNTISRSAANCLSRGDKIITNAYYDGYKSCVISSIHVWQPNPSAEVTATFEQASSTQARFLQ